VVHEWALAEAIAEYIAKLADEKACKEVEEIEVRLGALQSIDREILDYALHELLRMRGVTVGKVTYRDVEPLLACRRCGFEWSVELEKVDEYVREAMHFVPETIYSFFKCPRCGSRDYEVVSGRGVEIGDVRWKCRS